MQDPRRHNEPKVKVASRTNVQPVNVIIVSVLLLVGLLLVNGVSGT